MKFGKIITFASVCLVLNLILRSFQLRYTIEITTGFFRHSLADYGAIMLGVIFFAALCSAAFAFLCCNSPENPPRPNLPLGISGILLGMAILAQVFLEVFSNVVPVWQVILIKLFGFASAAFLVVFGLLKFVKIKFPRILYIIPTVYFIFRLIGVFVNISSLALISDNLLLMAFYCSALWFWLQFAKLYNFNYDEKAFRSLLASGILTVHFAFTQSLPHIIVNIVTGSSYLHTSVVENLTVLLTGVFVAIFTLCHFMSNKNA